MSDIDNNDPVESPITEDAATEAAPAASAEAVPTAEPTIESLQADLAVADAKAAENFDMYLRANAETENVRKRVEREADKARKFALERFAGDLLAVVDSLQMGAEAATHDSATLESVREGLDLTGKMLSDVLEKFNIKTIEAVGEKFNPEFHEAMVMQPAPDAEPNTVLTVIQQGYILNGRVLRPARVIVAAAG
ncbi:MAG: molecular chaperone GrpE [Gammaproteobacteria bacterium]|jgi:molecular chaperone GrpE